MVWLYAMQFRALLQVAKQTRKSKPWSFEEFRSVMLELSEAAMKLWSYGSCWITQNTRWFTCTLCHFGGGKITIQYRTNLIWPTPELCNLVSIIANIGQYWSIMANKRQNVADNVAKLDLLRGFYVPCRFFTHILAQGWPPSVLVVAGKKLTCFHQKHRTCWKVWEACLVRGRCVH